MRELRRWMVGGSQTPNLSTELVGGHKLLLCICIVLRRFTLKKAAK